jgi:hypothetical protein
MAKPLRILLIFVSPYASKRKKPGPRRETFEGLSEGTIRKARSRADTADPLGAETPRARKTNRGLVVSRPTQTVQYLRSGLLCQVIFERWVVF